uniref:Aminopeptidase n=1 Tax=Tetranychus truncatus TaxID=93132 RepID=A0A3G5ANT2_9ACAR|nr:puromycin-sensitive aminopeptidase [Tetranychus truncatus]
MPLQIIVTILRSSVTKFATHSLRKVIRTQKNTFCSVTLQSKMATSLTAVKTYERLPKNVIPQLYKLELTPNLENFTFTGKEDVEVSIKESTNQVILNASQLEIQEALFKDPSGSTLKGNVTLDTQDEKLFIKFDESLKIGTGTISIAFSGILNDQMKGFYRSKYTTPSGEERYAATTQFEAPDARRAFPCWDEPAFKAQFEVTLIAPKDRTVLSNTEPVQQIQHPDNANLKIVKFAPTPIMSSYLLAFIVGEYDFLETITKNKTRVRIYTPVGKKDQALYALEIASKSLTFFEDYFNIPFPLSKLDHIAIPDFASGAMENWGLVTYREIRVLTDPKNTSSLNRELIAITIAHETAHQWFGNLVTMDWWTDLWLNEGFAVFMEYLAVDSIHPEFDIWSKFASYAALPALKLDSLRDSHPIEVPVSHPDDIDAIFDLISYEKGASIIRMCHDWIGDEAFRKGLYNYLSKHAYKNAVTQDLWDALEEVSGKPVGKVMGYWTKQKGYPVIEVESKQDGNNKIIKLTQRKFTLDGTLTDEESKVQWMVPITIVTSQDPNKVALSTLMTEKSTEITLPNVTADTWVKLNLRLNGFYRIKYSAEMLKALAPAISTKQLQPIDRVQILDDQFALLMAGEVSSAQFLELLSSYANEDNYVTWVAIDSCMSKLHLLLAYTDLSEKFAKFGINFYSKIYNELGFDIKDEKCHSENLLRALVLLRLAKFKYAPVIEESIRRFKAHIAGTPIHPDIRSSVYSAAASSCDDETFNTFFKLYRDTDLQEEKVRLIQSTGSTGDLARIRQLLTFAFSPEVRSQDAWRFILGTIGTKLGREEAWKFFKDNADEFKKRYGSHIANAALIENLTNGFASEEKYKEVESFFLQNTFSGHEKVILRSLETIKTHADWLKRETDNVRTFLESI